MANKLEMIGDSAFSTGAATAIPSFLIEAASHGRAHLELFGCGGVTAMIVGTVLVAASQVLEERSVNRSYSEIQDILSEAREQRLAQKKKEIIYKIH